MGTTKPNSKNIPDDILYHLELILRDLERIKLDNNRNDAIVFACKSLLQKVLLVAQLYERYDKPIFKALKNHINNMIKSSPNLRGIIVHVENSRCTDEVGNVQKFKIVI